MTPIRYLGGDRYSIELNAGLTFLLLLVSSSTLCADESLFATHCATCHTIDSSSPSRQGPTLEMIIGRPAGSVENFPYSQSLKDLDVLWNAELLDRWLTNPQAMASDSYMFYKQPDPEIRASIISFLMSLQ